MKTCRILFLLFVGLTASSLTLAQPTAPAKVDAKRLETLVKQLASSRYVEREDAQRELETIGAPALDALRAAVKDSDPEVSRRAADMVGRLEEKLTTAKLLAPKMVKLSLKDVSITEALDELKKASGYEVKLEVAADILANRKISLQTGEVTFFEALDKLCARAGLVEKIAGNEVRPVPRRPIRPVPLQIRPAPVQPIQPAPQGGLQVQPQLPGQPAPPQPGVKVLPARPILRPIVPRGGPQPLTLIDGKTQDFPSCYVGAVRVRLLPPNKARMKNKEGEALFVFQVAVEPHLNLAIIQNGLTITRAIDDQNQKLTAVEKPAADNVARPNFRLANPATSPDGAAIVTRTFAVSMKLGEKQAKSLKELTGSVIVNAQLPASVAAAIDNVLKAQNQTIKSKDGDASLTLNSVTKNGNGVYRVSYSLADANFQGRMGGINIVGGGVVIINGQAIGPGMVGPNGGDAESIQLVDAKGKAFKRGANFSSSMTIVNGAAKSTYTAEFRADAGQGEPVRLELVKSSRIDLNVPFRFKGVPLP